MRRLFEILPHKVKYFEVHGFCAELKKYPVIDPEFFEKLCEYISDHVTESLLFQKYRLSSSQFNKLLRAASSLKSISINSGKLLDEGFIIIDTFTQNLTYNSTEISTSYKGGLKTFDLSLNHFGAKRTKYLVEQLISTGTIYCFDKINLDDNSKSYDYSKDLKEAMNYKDE